MNDHADKLWLLTWLRKMLVHPRDGYELGNDDSKDNCAACKRKLLTLRPNNPVQGALDPKEEASDLERLVMPQRDNP